MGGARLPHSTPVYRTRHDRATALLRPPDSRSKRPSATPCTTASPGPTGSCPDRHGPIRSTRAHPAAGICLTGLAGRPAYALRALARVMHLTRLAIDHSKQPEGRWLTDGDARVAVAAALLHDIGHYPFPHAIEELGSPIVPHERGGRRLIEGSQIGPILEDAWGRSAAGRQFRRSQRRRSAVGRPTAARGAFRRARYGQTGLPASRRPGLQCAVRRRRHGAPHRCADHCQD